MKKYFYALPVLFSVIPAAHAELPAAVATTISGIQVDSLAAINLVWPLLLAVVGAFVLMKVVKRGIKAAT